MANSAITGPQRIIGDFASHRAEIPASKPVEEKLQKLLDKLSMLTEALAQKRSGTS